MDHLHAQQTQAVERYVLGELTAAEAEEFEIHFFECPQCAMAVDAGQEFIEGARASFREPRAEKIKGREDIRAPRPSFFERISEALSAFCRPVITVPAMAALAGIAAYEGVSASNLNRVLETARAVPAVQLIGASRGDEMVVPVWKGEAFAPVAFDVPPGASYKTYLCVLNSGDQEVLSVTSPAPADGQPITIQLPIRRLKDAHYDLMVYGLTPDGQRSDRISRYPFAVRF
ncbi:MAG TPA: zf-HC2 domain-containing protein [Bryobacteraceae bacterium]|nr:zf-HC2 domain-containing protein [Bryobacteraceae bacterium]